MDDLISRQQAIDEIKSVYEWHDVVTQDRLIEHLRQLPSAEPQERKGKWIPITFSEMTGYNPELSGDDPVYGHRCSVCNKECIVDDSGSDVLSNFCPNCGCKMEVTK